MRALNGLMDNERTLDGGYRHMDTCFMCQNRFKMGPHIFAGRGINGWDIVVCRVCYDQNHDGIVPSQHPRLVEHLQRIEAKVELNDDRFIKWPKE